MNKKQIIGLAFAVVLVCGFLFSAQAAPVQDRDGASNSVASFRVMKTDLGDLKIPVVPSDKNTVEPHSYRPY